MNKAGRARLVVVAMVAALAASSAWPLEGPAADGRSGIGPPPGPPVLSAPPARSPLLENAGRWHARPILVSGAFAYRDGEFLYQDYLFDDHGANTTDLPLSPQPRPNFVETGFGGVTGDVVYPTDEARYGYNATDLVELRLRMSHDGLAFRFTLNTLLAAGSTAIAVGIDTNGGSRRTSWGHGLGSLGPLDLEHVLYTDGVGAVIDGTWVAASTDLRRNQIEVVVPRSVLDPGGATWRLYAVTGIADHRGGFRALAEQPTSTRPGGRHGTHAPPVFNVAFRLEAERDEPMGSDLGSTGSRGAGHGAWREHAQARALAARDISRFAADVDFGLLASGRPVDHVPRTGYMDLILVSHFDPGEGVSDHRPRFLGQLQPYGAFVPDSAPRTGASFLLLLHSLAANHNQYAVFSPHIYRDLCEGRGAICITPLGRGPDGWYIGDSELDVFDAWADVGSRYSLDPDRVGIAGYSMGGYGTFRLATLYPDLFGKAFPVVGPATEGLWLGVGPNLDPWAFGPSPETNTTYLLENLRWIPLLIWHGAGDELVPVLGAVGHAGRLDRLRYRYRQDLFTSDHFAIGMADDWSRAATFLGRAGVTRDPPHVTFSVQPATDAPGLGLVHDHAYWVWGVRLRRIDGGASVGTVDARSLAAGVGDPGVVRVAGAGTDPLPYVEHGIRWLRPSRTDPRNGLVVTLVNVSDATLGLAGAGVDPKRPMTLRARTDGPVILRLAGSFPSNVRVMDTPTGGTIPSSLHQGVLSIALAEGTWLLAVVAG